MLFRSAPIQDVAPALIQRISSGNAVNVIIEGVDEAVARGFREEKGFHELGAPWAGRP